MHIPHTHSQAAPESVIDGLLANIRTDVLQRIKPILPPALEPKVPMGG